MKRCDWKTVAAAAVGLPALLALALMFAGCEIATGDDNSAVNAETPVIETPPKSASYAQNASAAALSVTARVSDGGELSYQWYSNDGNNDSSGTAIDGETGTTYTPPTAIIGTVYYYVIVTNTNNEASGENTARTVSNVAAISIVSAETPIVDDDPQSAVYDRGDAAAALSVTARVGDGGTLLFQWYSNNKNSSTGGTAIDGATGTTYTPPTANIGAVYYYVIVRNVGTAAATATSAVAKIEVEPLGTKDDPKTKVVASSVNISNMDWWTATSDAVKKAGKYVILDLSACSATGNTVYGSDNSNDTNAMNSKIRGAQYIAGIILPNSLTKIEANAFSGCTSLTSISIPSSVEKIMNSAFFSCTSLTSISIPEGKLTEIGKTAFAGCTGLTSISIPNNVRHIYPKAFSSCPSLVSVDLSDGSLSLDISENVFEYNTSLASITLPARVISLWHVAFDGCTSLTSVTFATGSNIAAGSIGVTVFPEGPAGKGGDSLKTAYVAAASKAGTYTRAGTSGTDWKKQ